MVSHDTQTRDCNTSELGGRSLEEGEADLEGILALGVPGLEQGGQIQTGVGAPRAAHAVRVRRQ